MAPCKSACCRSKGTWICSPALMQSKMKYHFSCIKYFKSQRPHDGQADKANVLMVGRSILESNLAMCLKDINMT